MLKFDIGSNAGVIWSLLSTKGRLSLKEICKHANSSESVICMALGWLIRENKIHCKEHEDDLYVELLNSPTEIFY